MVLKWYRKSLSDIGNKKPFVRLLWSLKHSWDAENVPKSEPYSGIHSASPSWGRNICVALVLQWSPRQSLLPWNLYSLWGEMDKKQIYYATQGIRQGDVTDSDVLRRRTYWRLCGQGRLRWGVGIGDVTERMKSNCLGKIWGTNISCIGNTSSKTPKWKWTWYVPLWWEWDHPEGKWQEMSLER